MFALGFPPVPFSITNTNVDRRYAKDNSTPFSLLEFIKVVANLVDSNNITSYYNHYVTIWNNLKNKQTSTSEILIVESYRAFVKDLTLNYNSVAENKFLSNIDYSDPYDLDVATKFIADKIKSIALYYRDKREDVKLETTRKKYKASNKGVVTSIKEKIIDYLKNSNTSLISGNISDIFKKLTVSIDSLYDNESSYFNKQPDDKIYGRYDLDYNEDIFLTSNNQLVSKIFSGLNADTLQLREENDLFDSKRELTKKYMGTDFFYISATQVLSSVPVLNVQSNTSIRYNKEFIRLQTTIPNQIISTTISPPITLEPVITTKEPEQPQKPQNTTSPPPSFVTEPRRYECINFTCIRSENGSFETLSDCRKTCSRPPVDPTPDPDKDPKPSPTPTIGSDCGCGSIKKEFSINRVSQAQKCLQSSVVDKWKTLDYIAFNCPLTGYQMDLSIVSTDNIELVDDGGLPRIIKSPNGARIEAIHSVQCSNTQKKQYVGMQYRAIITNTLTNKHVATCYFSSNSPNNNVDVTPCCAGPDTPPGGLPTTTPSPGTDGEVTTSQAPGGPTTSQAPSGATTTTECPECETEDEDEDNKPTPDDTPDTTDCPDCPSQYNQQSGASKGRSKTNDIDNSPPSTTSSPSPGPAPVPAPTTSSSPTPTTSSSPVPSPTTTQSLS